MISDIPFSKAELERYSRHLILPEFNIEGQRKLKAAKVLVVGVGGLGSPLLLYLTAAGVGTIGLVDFDKVDESNLQRQVLFSVEDVGMLKVEAATKRLRALNPHVQINVHETKLTSENGLEIMQGYDVVADGTDNFATRYLINDACVLLGVPNIYGSIYRFEGQVSVFNYTDEQGNIGPNYRDLFPEPPPPDIVPSCAEGGVIGVLPGIIGSLQANEVIKVVTGVGEPLTGRLFLFDAASFISRTIKIPKDPANPLTGKNPTITELIDYDQFCGISSEGEKQAANPMKEITVKELAEVLENGGDVQIVDVREPYEYEIANIGGELIPLTTVINNVHKFSSDRRVVVHCRSGKRSAEAIQLLEQQSGLSNLYNLKGGLLAWASEIDPDMPAY